MFVRRTLSVATLLGSSVPHLSMLCDCKLPSEGGMYSKTIVEKYRTANNHASDTTLSSIRPHGTLLRTLA